MEPGDTSSAEPRSRRRPRRIAAAATTTNPTTALRSSGSGPSTTSIAGWWILNGVWGIVESLLFTKSISIFGLVFGAITALVGLRLILRVELARNIVNIICWLQILFGILGFLFAFTLSFAIPLLAAIAMIRAVIQVVLSLVMVFVIGETGPRAPNF
jgi:vacuolar-type H+-ATPase subunit I/STV1